MTRQSHLAACAALIFAFSVTGYADPIRTLKGVSVPQPSSTELAKYVINKPLALAMGKSLFWDMQVGSDGVQSCASCHFKAGADNRSFNQVSATTASLNDPNFNMVAGPNAQLTPANFPTRANDIDVVSSQGMCKAQFRGIIPGSAVDASSPLADAVYNIGGRNVRRVEPRNTPTSISAVFTTGTFGTVGPRMFLTA